MKGLIDSSARWHVDFMNSIPAALYRTTIEGRIVYCNRSFMRIFGFDSVGELIGYPVIDFYRNKKDRGILVDAVMQRGRVSDVPVALVKRDGSPIWCAVTARGVLDDDGMVVHIDGMLKDITGEIEEESAAPSLNGAVGVGNDVIIIFDLQGIILDINANGSDLLGYTADKIRGRALTEFIVPRLHELFLLFLSDILKFGSEQVVFSLKDSVGEIHVLDCHAMLVKKEDRAHHIKGVAQDVTNRMVKQKSQLNQDKLEGVLEMAGGVAHRLNQPLTVVNNLVEEVIAECRPHDTGYEKMKIIQSQIHKMNDITQKISNVKKYAAMEYVAGVKIVDLDRAS